MALAGHLWTLGGFLRRTLSPAEAPPSRPWETHLDDSVVGSVRLTGNLSEVAEARALVIVIHGLGGSSDSPYVVEAAARLARAGISCLRLNLRGADRSGEDIYHAGLTADLMAALVSPEVAAYEKVALLGFSLGGHVALRMAVDDPPARLRAVATICPPVDLAAAATAIDAWDQWIYRRYLLARLLEIYSQVARRHELARSVAEVRQAKTFVEFDSLVIAPRHGFIDAWDYYRAVSVGPDLVNLRIPTLLLAAEGDPMVPVESLDDPLSRASDLLECHRVKRGGHLSFSPDLDLGSDAETGLYSQVVGWLDRQLLV